MIRLTPISITTTSQSYLVDIAENLIQPFCANAQGLPKVSVSFQIVDQQPIGIQATGTQYVVTLDASISVIYRPMGSTASVVRQFNEQFRIAFVASSAKLPTIVLAPSANIVSADCVKCNGSAYGVRVVTPLTINATFPA